jgi:hypothetical protein
MDIKLIVSAKNASNDVARSWYQSLKRTLPSGVLTTAQVKDQTASMTLKKTDDKVIYVVPLVRELTANEVEAAIHAFDEKVEIDFTVEADQTKVDENPNLAVELPETPVLELCTTWAKRKHDDWMKEKVDAGWRYGTQRSAQDQTHPLLRPWAELPEDYRKVDTQPVEELLKLLNDSGYLLLKKEELDALKPKA